MYCNGVFSVTYIYGILGWLVIHGVSADYDCLCNYNIELGVYPTDSSSSQPIGYLYEFDCKPLTTHINTESDMWATIQYEHKVGYVVKDDNIQVQICAGAMPMEDRMTTRRLTTILQTISTLTTPIPTTTTPTTATPTISTPTTTTPTTTTILTTTTSTKTTPTTTTPTTTTPTTTTPTTSPSTTTTPTTTTPTTTTPTTTTPTTTTPTTTTPTTTTPTTTTPTTTTRTTTPTTKSIIVPAKSCQELLSQTANVDSGTVMAYKDKCYELIRHQARWVDAELHCRDLGGNLVNIRDGNEEKIIYETMSTYYNQPIWIGLHDLHHEESFQWTSGMPVEYTNWQPGRLSSSEHWNEDCVAMEMDGNNAGYWNDHDCMETKGYVCQFVRQTRAVPLFG